MGFSEIAHCREEGCIGKYTPRGPKGAQSPPSGNLSFLVDVFPFGSVRIQYIPSRGSVWPYGHSLITNPSLGCIRNYIHKRAISIIVVSMAMI